MIRHRPKQPSFHGLKYRMTMLGLGAALTACGATPDSESPQPMGMDDRLGQARIALAQHLGRSADAAELISMDRILWRDSSLGCAEPGQKYEAVVTPGEVVLLELAGEVHRVHMTADTTFVCASPESEEEGRPLVLEGYTRGRMEERVRADLARRLSLPVDQIEVLGSREVQWTDSSLGCAERGRAYQPVRSAGWVITLGHHGRQTVYHADRYRAFPCPAIEAQ